jgi:crotonobetainyl-CoA:carnitine CoA-transferase CaiB-like acyl-CoA transferase
MYLTGDADREPLKEGGSIMQFSAGADAFVASLAAFFYAAQTGLGQHVDVSIMEVVATLLDINTLRWNQERIPVKRNSNYHKASSDRWGGGNGIFPCKDGFIGVEIPSAADLPKLAKASGIEKFGDSDIGYVGWGALADPEKLHALILKWGAENTVDEIFQATQQERVPWGRVHNIEQVWNWAQYRERGFWKDIDHPKAGSVTYPARPFIMSETPLVSGRAPLLGEHNEEIVGQRLGYSIEKLTQLSRNGLI